MPYDANGIDESVLWAQSSDVGDGFRCIRMINNITLNFDALRDGDIEDGTQIVLWEWCEGENQSWKIIPWCKNYLSCRASISPKLQLLYDDSMPLRS